MAWFSPLGFRADGRPFYGFAGAGEDEEDQDVEQGQEESGSEQTRLEATLKKVSDERRAVRDEFRPWKAAIRELGIESPDALREALKGGKPQFDQNKIREEERAAARLEANRDVAIAKVEAAAKGRFADPADAVDYVRKNVDDLLGKDGKPDQKAIDRELEELLAAKPHWGLKPAGSVGFDGGARQSAGSPPKMDDWLRKESDRKRGK